MTTERVINVSGARGESFADVARRVGSIGGTPVAEGSTDAQVLTALANSAGVNSAITAAVAAAEAAGGPTYANTAAGIAATVVGEAFAVDNGNGTVTIYLHTVGGVAVAQRTLATTDAIQQHIGAFPAITVGVVADQGAAINAALNLAPVMTVFLPVGVIWVSTPIVVPNGKTLQGPGMALCTIKPMDAFPVLNGVVNGPGAGGTCTMRGFTVDVRELNNGGGTNNRVHGIVLSWTRNFLVEECAVTGATAYAFWAVGGDNDVDAKYSSGTFRHCYSENSSVGFEQTACDGILLEDCHARKTTGAVGAFSCFHALQGSRNITYRDCTGYGAANAGFDPQADAGGGDLGRLTLENCHIELTGNGVGFAVAPGQPSDINEIYMSGCRFVVPDGIALSLLKTKKLRARHCYFEGEASAIYVDDANAIFETCDIKAATDPGGGTAAVGIAINALRDPSHLLRVIGGSTFDVSGPAGSTPINGIVLAWVGSDVRGAGGGFTSAVTHTEIGNVALTAKPGSFVETAKDAGGSAFNGNVRSDATMGAAFLFEIVVPERQALLFGLTTTQNPAEYTADHIAGLKLTGDGGVVDRVDDTPYGVYPPGERFWLRRMGSRIEIRQGGARFEDAQLVVVRTSAAALYFHASLYTEGDTILTRGRV
jgi:hypothetical protein